MAREMPERAEWGGRDQRETRERERESNLGFVMLLKLEHDTGAQIFPPLRAMKAYRSVVVEAAQNPRGGCHGRSAMQTTHKQSRVKLGGRAVLNPRTDALAPQSEIGLALQLIWIGR